MIPKTLSASSLQTAVTCLARYHAENILRTPDIQNNAARVGTAVHGALEGFVKALKFDGTATMDFKLLEAFYQVSFSDTFGTTSRESDEYLDGFKMLMDWFERNLETFQDVNVLSCEVKTNFPVQTSIGTIPFTYIWDRCDRIDEKTIKVVDYKTERKYTRPEDLRSRLQVRAYGLAAQMKWPDAEQIWVELDLLRHRPVSIVLSREDNKAFYYYIVEEAERIIATDPDATDNKGKPIPLPETLSDECGWCVRKSHCDTLLKHNAGGGVLGLSPEQVARMRMEVAAQIKALRILDEQLDGIICKEAEQEDKFDWEEGDFLVNITAKKSRKLSSPAAAAKIIGPELLQRYGNLTITNLDKLMKSGELTELQSDQLKSLIEVDWSEPRSIVKAKKGF